METLNEGEALNKIKKGLKGAAIGAGVLGATAAGITGYGAVNGVRQARAEKAAQERQADEERAAKDQYANDIAQNLHKRGVEFKEKGTEMVNDTKEFQSAYKEIRKFYKDEASYYTVDENGEKVWDYERMTNKWNSIASKYDAKTIKAVNDTLYKQLSMKVAAQDIMSALKEHGANVTKNVTKKAKEFGSKVKDKLVKEDVNYFPY